MKNIWIDGYEANVPQRLGSSQLAFEIIKNIEKFDKKNDYTILLPDKPLSDLPKEREGFKYKILKPKKLWTRIALPLALFLSKQKPDVFFAPTHYLPRFIPKNIKKVVTIFDLSFLHFPQMFKKSDLYKLTNWTKLSIKNADRIITISNSSKKDILKNYNLDKKKLTVCFPGYDSKVFHHIVDQQKINQIKARYNIGGDYIIYIGTIQPRKNLIRLIEAFSRIILSDQRGISNESKDSSASPQNDKLQLVIVGKTTGEGRSGWMYEDILEKPKELGIEDRIIFTGFIASEDLPYLLNGSIALVNISLWEGFGIPIVEAMACGVPVIVSNVSSLPEVTGNTGLLVDPTKSDQIEQAIRTIFTDKKLRAKLSKKSLERSKKFSWKKMAREVVKVFESV